MVLTLVMTAGVIPGEAYTRTAHAEGKMWYTCDNRTFCLGTNGISDPEIDLNDTENPGGVGAMFIMGNGITNSSWIGIREWIFLSDTGYCHTG